MVRSGGLETGQLPRSSVERGKRGNQFRIFILSLVYGSKQILGIVIQYHKSLFMYTFYSVIGEM